MKRITRRFVRAGLGAAVVLGVVTGAAAPQERVMRRGAAERKPERVDVRKPESELAMHRFGPRPVIEAHVDGNGPFRFYLDTGAGGSAITAELAKALGMEVVAQQRVGAPGTDGIDVDVVRVDSLVLDGIALHGLELPTLPADRLGGKDAPQGVFSLRELPGLLVTFDFAGGRILLASGALPEPDGKTVLAFESPRGIPEVPVRIAGIEFAADLDTGSPGGFTLPLDRAGGLPLAAPPVEVGKGRMVGGDVTIYEARLNGTAELGGYAFENPTLRFTDRGSRVHVGAGLLERYTLTIDRANQRLRLVESAPAKATGDGNG